MLALTTDTGTVMGTRLAAAHHTAPAAPAARLHVQIVDRSIVELGAWGVHADGTIEPSSSASRRQASQAVQRSPCAHAKYGDDRHPQRAFAFGGDGARREIGPAMVAMFRSQGYILLKSSADTSFTSQLHTFSTLLNGFDLGTLPGHHPVYGRDTAATAQPHRSKHLLCCQPGHDLLSQANSTLAVPGWQPLLAAFARLQPVFFFAYHFLRRQGPDYEGHRTMDPSSNYLAKVLDIATLSVQDNLADRGATFQNPHWDYANWEPGYVFIDIPLRDVSTGGAPLEIWPGTHTLLYNDTFVQYDAMLRTMRLQENRQYYLCFPEINAMTQLLPSALMLSSFGDMIVRSPAMWHRGTPNRLDESRHMITLAMQAKGKHKGRLATPPTADGRSLRKRHEWG
uniref:Phytanoyl-CoA dioxygenase n=1 Tax=Prymnesium polylepis TaxID=72548 RepID=A0A7S4I5K3_9EUKA